MESGTQYVVVGYESNVTEQINAARDSNQLLRLELDRIPTGQYCSINPNRVEGVKGDAW